MYSVLIGWFLGEPAVDRSERPAVRGGRDALISGNHTIKFGEDLRHNRDFLLQTQDNGGRAGVFEFRGPQTAMPTDAAAQDGFANAFRVVPARRAAVWPRPQGGRSGDASLADFTFIQDEVERHADT